MFPSIGQVLQGLESAGGTFAETFMLEFANLAMFVNRIMLLLAYYLNIVRVSYLGDLFKPMINATALSLSGLFSSVFVIVWVLLGLCYLLAPFVKIEVVRTRSALTWFVIGFFFFQNAGDVYVGIDTFRQSLASAIYSSVTDCVSGLTARCSGPNGLSGLFRVNSVGDSAMYPAFPPCDNVGPYLYEKSADPSVLNGRSGIDVAMAFLRMEPLDVMGRSPTGTVFVKCGPLPSPVLFAGGPRLQPITFISSDHRSALQVGSGLNYLLTTVGVPFSWTLNQGNEDTGPDPVAAGQLITDFMSGAKTAGSDCALIWQQLSLFNGGYFNYWKSPLAISALMGGAKLIPNWFLGNKCDGQPLSFEEGHAMRLSTLLNAQQGVLRAFYGMPLSLFAVLEQATYFLTSLTMGISFIMFSVALLFGLFVKTEPIAMAIVNQWISLIIMSVALYILSALILGFCLLGANTGSVVLTVSFALLASLFGMFMTASALKVFAGSINTVFDSVSSVTGMPMFNGGDMMKGGMALATGGASLAALGVGALGAATADPEAKTADRLGSAAGIMFNQNRTMMNAARTLTRGGFAEGTAFGTAAESFVEAGSYAEIGAGVGGVVGGSVGAAVGAGVAARIGLKEAAQRANRDELQADLDQDGGHESRWEYGDAAKDDSVLKTLPAGKGDAKGYFKPDADANSDEAVEARASVATKPYVAAERAMAKDEIETIRASLPMAKTVESPASKDDLEGALNESPMAKAANRPTDGMASKEALGDVLAGSPLTKTAEQGQESMAELSRALPNKTEAAEAEKQALGDAIADSPFSKTAEETGESIDKLSQALPTKAEAAETEKQALGDALGNSMAGGHSGEANGLAQAAYSITSAAERGAEALIRAATQMGQINLGGAVGQVGTIGFGMEYEDPAKRTGGVNHAGALLGSTLETLQSSVTPDGKGNFKMDQIRDGLLEAGGLQPVEDGHEKVTGGVSSFGMALNAANRLGLEPEQMKQIYNNTHDPAKGRKMEGSLRDQLIDQAAQLPGVGSERAPAVVDNLEAMVARLPNTVEMHGSVGVSERAWNQSSGLLGLATDAREAGLPQSLVRESIGEMAMRGSLMPETRTAVAEQTSGEFAADFEKRLAGGMVARVNSPNLALVESNAAEHGVGSRTLERASQEAARDGQLSPLTRERLTEEYLPQPGDAVGSASAFAKQVEADLVDTVPQAGKGSRRFERRMNGLQVNSERNQAIPVSVFWDTANEVERTGQVSENSRTAMIEQAGVQPEQADAFITSAVPKMRRALVDEGRSSRDPFQPPVLPSSKPSEPIAPLESLQRTAEREQGIPPVVFWDTAREVQLTNGISEDSRTAMIEQAGLPAAQVDQFTEAAVPQMQKFNAPPARVSVTPNSASVPEVRTLSIAILRQESSAQLGLNEQSFNQLLQESIQQGAMQPGTLMNIKLDAASSGRSTAEVEAYLPQLQKDVNRLIAARQPPEVVVPKVEGEA